MPNPCRNRDDLASPESDVQAALSHEIESHEIEWRVSTSLTDYDEALAFMEARAAAIRAGEARELVWLVEHPPLYTAGTSADPDELFNPMSLPVFAAGRGGRYTYHGPGQRVGYLMLDLDRRGRDVRRFVAALEDWLIATLGRLGVAARREAGRIGIWVGRGSNEAKVGAIGVRVRRWVTMHGFSINLRPELSHFSGIVPCGIVEFPVTSLDEIGVTSEFQDFDLALKHGFDHFLLSLEAATEKA